MRQTILSGLTAAIAICPAAKAEVPDVAVDIAPVHSLVAQVMGDLGTPTLILPPGASPHGYALRPSEARTLAGADLVIWVGPELTPWLEDTIGTLAGGAEAVALLQLPGTLVLPFRDEAVFSISEATGADDEDHEDHDHDHDDHDHEEDGHEDHDHEEDGHDDHDHSGTDPHAWLDTANAAVWVAGIAETLSAADPENAVVYRANAEAAIARIKGLETEIQARLGPIRGMPYVVFHDGFQYFESRFDLPALGAISLGDATDPGAARVSHIRDLVKEAGVACVAAEPQFNPSLVRTIASGTDVRTTVVDPLGAELEPGSDFYMQMMSNLAGGLLACQG